MASKSISIIIPTKDRAPILEKTIEALSASVKGLDYEVIVVNDSKTASVVLAPGQMTGHIRIIDNPKQGVASARNLGARMAEKEWLLFLDDDMIILEENFRSYLNYTDMAGKLCVNVEWVYTPDMLTEINKNAFGRFLIKYGFTTMRGWSNYPDWPENSSVPVSSMSSPNLFIRKADFISTGGYDEAFPFAGFEDYAFSKRLEHHGFNMYVDTTSLMYHNESDRLEPVQWYERKRRGSETRKIAVEQGFGEVGIEYGPVQKLIYSNQAILRPLVSGVVSVSSRFRFLDALSFSCYKVLLGMTIFKGYTKK